MSDTMPSSPESAQQPELGNDAQIIFRRFNAETVAKVDTGATMSSINAQDAFYNKDTGTVTFKSPAIVKDKHRSITVDVADIVEVASADGGSTQRYVIQLDIEIAGQRLNAQLFNLSDREHMDYDVLIGQNILKAGNFVVDVNQGKEDDDDKMTLEQFIDRFGDSDEKIGELVEHLQLVDFTVRDFVKYVKRQTVHEIHGN